MFQRLAVLVSGEGTILEAMIEAGLPIQVVLADRQCRGIKIAQAAGIPTIIVDRKKYGFKAGQDWDRRRFTKTVIAKLVKDRVGLVAMSGFMTLLTEDIEQYMPFLNTHPSLLPLFKGEHAVQDALRTGVSETGCTIHIATRELDDHRHILAQAKVPVLHGDSVDRLHERIKQVERQLYPRLIRDILEGRIQLP